MTPSEQGKEARKSGIVRHDNPYPLYSHDSDLWREGWEDENWRLYAKKREEGKA